MISLTIIIPNKKKAYKSSRSIIGNMTEKISKHDFVELEYTGKLSEGIVFDTTSEKVAKENGIYSPQTKYGSAVICVGEKQLLPGLDDSLEGKEIGTEFEVKLSPEKAFGKRDVKNMRIIPLSTFKDHKVQPMPGLQVDVDGMRGIVSRVSGGRVIVNFNHPLAGKEVVYHVKLNRKVEDSSEKLRSYLNMAFRIPEEQLNVKVQENKAKVELPFEMPPQVTEALSKKLAELTKIKEVEFVKKTLKA